MRHARPFDAVLLLSFGGPQGPDEVLPFLRSVLRGRRVPEARVAEVAGHYALFGGVSPLVEITGRQARGLRERLAGSGPDLPVHVGMRHGRPSLGDVLAELSAAGVRRACGIILATHPSFSSCGQYRRDVAHARAALASRGLADVEVAYVSGWHDDARFVRANALAIADACDALPEALRAAARVVFTAHSIPLGQAEASRYREQLLASARRVAAAGGRPDWALVYQSRSGRPEDPWLGPDVCDYLREVRAAVPAVVLCPLGFVSDHVEVLFDLDRQAAELCRELGLPMARARTVNDHPLFLDLLVERVRALWEHHARHRVLPLRDAWEASSPASGPAMNTPVST